MLLGVCVAGLWCGNVIPGANTGPLSPGPHRAGRGRALTLHLSQEMRQIAERVSKHRENAKCEQSLESSKSYTAIDKVKSLYAKHLSHVISHLNLTFLTGTIMRLRFFCCLNFLFKLLSNLTNVRLMMAPVSDLCLCSLIFQKQHFPLVVGTGTAASPPPAETRNGFIFTSSLPVLF